MLRWRPVIWIAVALLLGAAVVSWLVPPPPELATPAPPPGQFPISEPRWFWPGVRKKYPYKPGVGMGSNTVNFPYVAPKVACALASDCA